MEVHATVGMVKSSDEPNKAALLKRLRDALTYFKPGEDSKDLIEALSIVEQQSAVS
jgi:hypothetical protein